MLLLDQLVYSEPPYSTNRITCESGLTTSCCSCQRKMSRLNGLLPVQGECAKCHGGLPQPTGCSKGTDSWQIPLHLDVPKIGYVSEGLPETFRNAAIELVSYRATYTLYGVRPDYLRRRLQEQASSPPWYRFNSQQITAWPQMLCKLRDVLLWLTKASVQPVSERAPDADSFSSLLSKQVCHLIGATHGLCQRK